MHALWPRESGTARRGDRRGHFVAPSANEDVASAADPTGDSPEAAPPAGGRPEPRTPAPRLTRVDETSAGGLVLDHSGEVPRAALIARHDLGGVLSVSGHPTWGFLNIRDANGYSAFEIKTLFLQEVFARGILTNYGGTVHQLNLPAPPTGNFPNRFIQGLFVEPNHLLACEEGLAPRYLRLGDAAAGSGGRSVRRVGSARRRCRDRPARRDRSGRRQQHRPRQVRLPASACR